MKIKWVLLSHWQKSLVVLAVAFPVMSGALIINHKIRVAKGDQDQPASRAQERPEGFVTLESQPEPVSPLQPAPVEAPPPVEPAKPVAAKPKPVNQTSQTQETRKEAQPPAQAEQPAQSEPSSSSPIVESPPQKKTYPSVNTSRWGISLNPFPYYVENEAVAEQTVKQAVDLGVNIIRLDYPVNWSYLEPFYPMVVQKIRSQGIDVVMSFQPPKTYETANPWQDGFDLGKKIAGQFGGQVIYQIGNEICGNAVKPGWPGTNKESFYEDKLEKVRAWVKGASSAVSQYAPGASQATTGHWLHFWCMNEILNGDGGIANIKILGWDWFNDSNQDLTKVKSGDETINLVEKLQETANGRELWIMESGNQRGGYAGEQYQADYLERLALHIRSTKAFKAFFYFYLHDDANKIETDPDDGSRGLIRIEKDKLGSWQIGGLKPAYERYKQIISQFK